MKAEKPQGAICGGNHMSRKWTRKEALEHFINCAKDMSCIDCCCGISFQSHRKDKVWII